MRYGPDGRAVGGVDLECWKEFDGKAVIFALGKVAVAIDAHRTLFRDANDALSIFNERNHPGFQFSVVDARGANTFFAGGGKWAAHRVGYGLFNERGLLSAKAAPLGVGMDGHLFSVPDVNNQRGFVIGDDVYDADGDLKTGVKHHFAERYIPARDFRAYRNGECSWRNDDGAVENSRYGRALMIPGEAVGGCVYIDIAGEAWIVYHNGFVLRARPHRSSVGIPVDSSSSEHYFGHDAIVLPDGLLKAGWCVNAGERASEYQHRTIDFAKSVRVDFARLTPAPSVQTFGPLPRAVDMLAAAMGTRGDAWPKGNFDLQIDSVMRRAKWMKGDKAAYEWWDDDFIYLHEDHSDETPSGYVLVPGTWYPRVWQPGYVLKVMRPGVRLDIQDVNAAGVVSWVERHWWYTVEAEFASHYQVPGYGPLDIIRLKRTPVHGDGTPQFPNGHEYDWCDASGQWGRVAWEDGRNRITWFSPPTPNAPRPRIPKPVLPWPTGDEMAFQRPSLKPVKDLAEGQRFRDAGAELRFEDENNAGVVVRVFNDNGSIRVALTMPGTPEGATGKRRPI